MKTFLCVVLLAACALAAPAPEAKREKRGFLHGFGHGFGHGYSSYSLGSYGLGSGYSSYSSPIISHAPVVYSSPAIIHEPTIEYLPRVVTVKKFVSVPHVSHHVSHHVSAPRISYGHYAPSYSAGWW